MGGTLLSDAWWLLLWLEGYHLHGKMILTGFRIVAALIMMAELHALMSSMVRAFAGKKDG